MSYRHTPGHPHNPASYPHMRPGRATRGLDVPLFLATGVPTSGPSAGFTGRDVWLVIGLTAAVILGPIALVILGHWFGWLPTAIVATALVAFIIRRTIIRRRRRTEENA